jgi:DNA-binding NarL/FixJ family response regulator
LRWNKVSAPYKLSRAQNYIDFPTDKFGIENENTGQMNTVPVFLLVEPSPILRSILNGWLETVITNPHILIAASGIEALQLATQEVPSYILIEINLPDKRGLEVLHQLRQDLPEARIVATSWYESSRFLDRVRSAGADGFVSKDKLPSELLPLWDVSIE